MNQINMIQPYRAGGQWVFDDEDTGLDQEPFVAGTDAIISAITSDIPNAENGFTLLFSDSEFPGSTFTLSRLNEQFGGWWYRCSELLMDGWLCPALFRYYDEAPEQLFVQVKVGVSVKKPRRSKLATALMKLLSCLLLLVALGCREQRTVTVTCLNDGTEWAVQTWNDYDVYRTKVLCTRCSSYILRDGDAAHTVEHNYDRKEALRVVAQR